VANEYVLRAQHRRRWLPSLLLALVILLNACAASADEDSQGPKIVDPVDHFDHCSAVADVNEHAGEVPQFDDITMVVLSIKE